MHLRASGLRHAQTVYACCVNRVRGSTQRLVPQRAVRPSSRLRTSASVADAECPHGVSRSTSGAASLTCSHAAQPLCREQSAEIAAGLSTSAAADVAASMLAGPNVQQASC